MISICIKDWLRFIVYGPSEVPGGELRSARTGECARPHTSNGKSDTAEFAQEHFAGSFLASQLLEEATDSFDPAMEVWDVELFVGCVEVVVREAEAHHDAGNFQHVLKIGHDGN